MRGNYNFPAFTDWHFKTIKKLEDIMNSLARILFVLYLNTYICTADWITFATISMANSVSSSAGGRGGRGGGSTAGKGGIKAAVEC